MTHVATFATLAALVTPGPGLAGVGSAAHAPAFCAPDPDPPEYYAFPLVTTKNVPGTGLAAGTARTTFPSSPFGVAVDPGGHYVHEVHLTFERLSEPPRGEYVAWVTTTQVDRIERLGVVEPGRPFKGRVAWNKFLVVVTLEDDDDPEATTWSGPIVLRGMSRSGMMHTMAGHGPFQQENCAAYGYD